MKGGRIAAAIAKTEESEAPPATVRIQLTTGRTAGVVVPADLTEREALDLSTYVTGQLRGLLEQQRQARRGLFVARGPLART